jgi:hypothetical protein
MDWGSYFISWAAFHGWASGNAPIAACGSKGTQEEEYSFYSHSIHT